jgi:polyisoprenoid-binding protein YceI
MKLFLAVLCLLAFPALAQDWKVNAVQSQVRFLIKQMNVPVEGGFKRFNVEAKFDPAKPEAGVLRVDLEASSIDTGSPEGDDEARRPIWFDAARHPRLNFASKSIKKGAEGRGYVATGHLTVKGQTRLITVPFSLTPQKTGTRLVEGRFPIRRADFNIGGGDWNEVVDDAAEVRFRFLLTR